MEEAQQAWADPKSLGISDRSFFKPEDGKTKRIKLLKDPVRAYVQFVNGMGFVHTLCDIDDKTGMPIFDGSIDEKLFGREPQMVWMAPVLVYDTDKKGQVGNTKAKNIEYEFQLWTFYATDYKRLYQMVVEWGIDEFNEKDLLVTGTKKGKYINADIAIAAKKALYLQPELKERVDADFATYPYKDTERWIARDATEDEIREALDKGNTGANTTPQGSVTDAIKK